MRSVSEEYKNQLKAIGRQYKAIITYSIDNEDYTLTNEDLNEVSPHYETDILKTCMKQLDLDSNVDIPIGTEINCQFGLLVDDDYEMINYGNYIVYSSEKMEDVNAYRIVCYDKLINAKVEYEALNITYPISVKDYLEAIATEINLTLATDEFVNDDTLIASERYLDSDGNSLGYTYFDVLDELAQVTASTICLNEDDELEVRYITDTQEATNNTRSRSLNDESVLPDGYTQVEYIKTPSDTNGPYIDTLVTLSDPPCLELDFMLGESATGSLYGYSSGSGVNKDFRARIQSNTPQSFLYFAFQSGEVGFVYVSSNIRYNLEINKSRWASNQLIIKSPTETIIDYTYSGDPSFGSVTFPLFGFKRYETGVAYTSKDIYIYSCKIYTGLNKTNLVRDYVPCLRNSDNEPGLYDLVNNVFYSNAGTGEFEYALPPQPPSELATIDEQLLNDTNVRMMKKYGPINSVVLSRSLDNDNIYRKDDESITENGLTEIKIADNQILNTDDRNNFIQEIYDELDGLEYYTNDYTSKGITYLDLCDKYQVKIADNVYPCVMLADELNVSSGFQELVHTDMPIASETDYTTASKSDRERQRTEFIVDKQNGIIESLVEKVVDITIDGTTTTNELTLSNVADSEPFNIIIRPLSANIESEYPSSSNYPSSAKYLKARAIRFHNETTDEDINYELPCDLLYYDEDDYDTFELDYDNQICRVLKKCEYNSQGQVVPVSSYTLNFDYPAIKLTRGDYTISVIDINNDIYIYCKLLALNDYTSQMATDIQVSSQIKQTADEIMIQVNEKVNEDDIIASLNVAVEDGQGVVALKGNSVTIESDNFQLDEYGNVTCNNSTMNNINIASGEIELHNDFGGVAAFRVYSGDGFNDNSVHIFGNAITMFGKDGETGAGVIAPPLMNIWVSEYNNIYSTEFHLGYVENVGGEIIGGDFDKISMSGKTGEIICTTITPISLESQKKNFEKLNNALDIIKNTDIYKYNFIDENDDDKKHIGFVIGENYNYKEDITSAKNNGVDLYSMVSVCFQAIKEQQEEIEQLKNQIKEMKK